MKSIRLGLWVAGGLLGLLWLTFGSPVDSPVQAALVDHSSADSGLEVEISQETGLVLTATVGSDPASCSDSATVQVRRDTVVYPCYQVENRSAITLGLHHIATRRLGVITDSFAVTLTPGAITNTVALGLVLTDVTSIDTTDLITWAARPYTPTQRITRTAVITLDIITPTLSIFKTVGIDPTRCASTTNLRVPSGATVYYCLRIENQGDEALTRHELADAPLNLAATLAYTLQPGATWVLTTGVLADFGFNNQLVRANMTAPFTNTVTLVSSTAGGVRATSASTATIDVGRTTVNFVKGVGTDPDVCSTNGTLSLPLGTPLYYCVSITNTGEVTLTSHALREPNLAIDIGFDYVLAPGELLTITNRVLTETLGELALFGPFNYSAAYPNVVNSSMGYSGTAIDGNNVASNSVTQVSAPPTPVPTATPTARPPSTNTPFPTNTPQPTNTPLPPTDTPTPTFTPQTPTATPTRSFIVSALATPTATPLSPAAVQATADAQIAMAETAAAQAAQAQEDVVATFTPQPDGTGIGASEVMTNGAGSDAVNVEDGNAVGEGADVPDATVNPAPDTALGTGVATATPEVVFIVVTDTPTPLQAIPDSQRPIVPPTPTATPDYLLAAATAIDAMAAAAGWIWFLLGSLVFFVSAGVVAGLFFRNQEIRRFELEPWADEDYWLPDVDETLPPYAGMDRTGQEGTRDEDDEWPAHLP